MSTFAVGDIHGNLPALDNLLDRITPLIAPSDTLVFLGDYIDGGPNPRGCIQRIIDLRRRAPFQTVALLGNHEAWMLKTMRNYTSHSWVIAADALKTIQSYSPDAATEIWRGFQDAGIRIITEKVPIPYDLFFDALPLAHREFFMNLQALFRNQDGLFVHGGVDSDRPIEEQRLETLIWGPTGFPESYRGPDILVYGHWSIQAQNSQGWPVPLILDNGTIGIDTISTGVLTAIRLPERTVFRSDRFVVADG